MRRMDTTEKTIGDNTFYIRPFSAFTSASISGELSSAIAPIIGELAPLLDDKDGKKDFDLEKIDVKEALPAIAGAIGAIDGDKLEHLMRRLLVDYKNVSVEGEITNNSAKLLSMDLANEIFCCELQDMLLLCYEVIKVNFGGFFKKLGVQFGDVLKASPLKTPTTAATEPLTLTASQSLS